MFLGHSCNIFLLAGLGSGAGPHTITKPPLSLAAYYSQLIQSSQFVTLLQPYLPLPSTSFTSSLFIPSPLPDKDWGSTPKCNQEIRLRSRTKRYVSLFTCAGTGYSTWKRREARWWGFFILLFFCLSLSSWFPMMKSFSNVLSFLTASSEVISMERRRRIQTGRCFSGRLARESGEFLGFLVLRPTLHDNPSVARNVGRLGYSWCVWVDLTLGTGQEQVRFRSQWKTQREWLKHYHETKMHQRGTDSQDAL